MRGRAGRRKAGTEDEPSYFTPGLIRWRQLTDVPFLIVAVGSLPLLLLELRRGDLVYGDRIALDVVNIVVLVTFAVDYCAELFLSQNRRQYIRHEWTSLAIVVSQAISLLPFFIGGASAFGIAAARVLRVVAVVLRVSAIGGASAVEGRTILRKHAAGFALGLAGLTWITSAVAFTLAEDVGAHGRIHSFGDALWWALATITTVGYGDIYPVTPLGRVIGGITMIVGISTFAIITAKVAEFLVRSDRESEVTASEQEERFAND